MAATPTKRSLDHLRALGFVVEVVERWIPGANIRRDFLGVADLLALKPGSPTLAIQATSATNVAARLTKLKAAPGTRLLLACGFTVEVWGWKKVGGRWTVRRVQLHGADLETTELSPRPPRRRRSTQRELFEAEK